MKTTAKIVLAIAAGVLCCNAVINLSNLDTYAGQGKPTYITKDNTPATNPLTDKGATLGRVLFYDKNLSANNSIACGSCHQQQFAFSDTATVSKGHLGGFTTRHAMRLVNARFANETHFFWDERAASLEYQTTQPIRNAVEMGYSGTGGQCSIDTLLKKLSGISYYKILFKFVYGDTVITETRLQQALAQFVRSIQSFDSKFDTGLSQTNNLQAPFPNYTTQENQGKALFLAPPPAGGAGCQGCHSAPEFDIDPNTKNNGIIGVANSPGAMDLTNTRAPSLRNIFNPSGQLNGPLMHDGSIKNTTLLLNHYNAVPQNFSNTNLDPRLKGPGANLNLSTTQKDAVVAFLKTLSGNAIYTDARWSDPFDATGNLSVILNTTGLAQQQLTTVSLYPNPTTDAVTISSDSGSLNLIIYGGDGRKLRETEVGPNEKISLEDFPSGVVLLQLTDKSTGVRIIKSVVKN